MRRARTPPEPPELRPEDGFYGHEATVFDKSDDYVAVRRNFALPRGFKVRWKDLGQEPVVLEVETADSGATWVRSITVQASGRPGVTAEALRRTQIGRLLREATASAVTKIVRTPDGEVKELRASDGTMIEAPMLLADRDGFLDGTPTRTITDEDLQRVAAIHRANPDAPARAVEEQFRPLISRATSYRYIKEARRRGFLGGAISRKAAER